MKHIITLCVQNVELMNEEEVPTRLKGLTDNKNT
jgi:hypothetical protein